MLQQLFSVLDSKANNYLPPFASLNEATASRQFSSAVQQEGHEFNQHAEDFTLWLLGEFDTESASLRSQTPKLIASASELIQHLNLVSNA